MIVTVTMNPAVDKTIFLDGLHRGTLNRMKRVVMDAGGKGINVSKTIAALGGNSIATGFLGGNNGRFIEKTLKHAGIRTDFVHMDAETRTNYKIMEADGTLTELNESGTEISAQKFSELSQKLCDYAEENTLFVLSGSVPPGISPDAYGRLIRRLKKQGACVFLDADGEMFCRGMAEHPDFIKPNRREALQYYGLSEETENQELIRYAGKFLKSGTDFAAVSLGSKGAAFLTNEGEYFAEALPVKAVSTVGAGDAMVAALCMGYEMKLPLREQMIFAMAVSAGAVETEGTKPPTMKRVRELTKQVVLKKCQP